MNHLVGPYVCMSSHFFFKTLYSTTYTFLINTYFTYIDIFLVFQPGRQDQRYTGHRYTVHTGRGIPIKIMPDFPIYN